jgi:hypothetical protein
MPLSGFEPTVPASEWPQTYALDSAATGIVLKYIYIYIYIYIYRLREFDTYVRHKVLSLYTKTVESRFIYHHSIFQTTAH